MRIHTEGVLQTVLQTVLLFISYSTSRQRPLFTIQPKQILPHKLFEAIAYLNNMFSSLLAAVRWMVDDLRNGRFWGWRSFVLGVPAQSILSVLNCNILSSHFVGWLPFAEAKLKRIWLPCRDFVIVRSRQPSDYVTIFLSYKKYSIIAIAATVRGVLLAHDSLCVARPNH